jgi:hypothetical protein
MWVQSSQFQQIDSALDAGWSGDIDRLLADILRTGVPKPATPTACAVCHRELVRSELQPDLVAFTCPEGHGAWMSADALVTLRRLVRDRTTAAQRKRRRIRVLSALLATSLAAMVASTVVSGRPVFPRSSASGAPIPAEERFYIEQLVRILADGISHRRDVEGVLQEKSEPATYAAVYQIYRERQGDVLARLRALSVPGRLYRVHDRIVVATERQIEFYGAFTDARVRGEAKDLAKMLGHPALRSSDYELHAAWDLIRGLYPNLDPTTSQTIEGTLCQFDVI